jgi:RNA polymerase sigma-70 factor (ECF subfamily)
MHETHPTDPTPELLVPGVLRGDAHALEQWYRAEHPVVWRLCLGFLVDAARADDCAQDAMLRLHDRLEHWDPARPWPAWRNAVVLNLCRDSARAERNRARALERLRREHHDRSEPPADTSLEQAEQRALVVAALRVLSPREREAFVLCELEQRPTDEVAHSMGIGASSVRSLITLARRRLGNQLALQTEAEASGGGA